ncbi:MAG TPA: PEP-CTERM sorting domain-containing protein [Gemmataceae bacterium]|nr:PEP-CTERM sorting domain-containing protein [Gemmataceae bacterium]
MKRAAAVSASWVFLVCLGNANAGLISFVSNPTTNSTDFAAYVISHGGTINTDVNFNTHPVGTLQPSFYQASDGVTLTPSGQPGAIDQVVFGSGPGDTNATSPPVSPGEGLHPPSNYLQSLTPLFKGPESLTISFDKPVGAVGLFTIDYFGVPPFDNPLQIEAFSGPDGTGASLGSFAGVRFNFQLNRLYFMGVASDTGNDIGSFVFSRPTDTSGDNIGLDDIRFARFGPAAVIPEPASLLLAGLGAVGLGGAWWRKKQARMAANS